MYLIKFRLKFKIDMQQQKPKKIKMMKDNKEWKREWKKL